MGVLGIFYLFKAKPARFLYVLPEDTVGNSSPDPFENAVPLQVYNQITETLHVIFTLYSEFKSNQHFSKAGSLAFPVMGMVLARATMAGSSMLFVRFLEYENEGITIFIHSEP